MVAQVVERWHSVRACREGLGFLSSELLFIYSHWVSGFLYERVIEQYILLHLLLSKFLSSFTIVSALIILYQ